VDKDKDFMKTNYQAKDEEHRHPFISSRKLLTSNHSLVVAKNLLRTYLKSLTVIINIVTSILPIRVYFFLKEIKHTF
jgi:hypothetical protein